MKTTAAIIIYIIYLLSLLIVAELVQTTERLDTIRDIKLCIVFNKPEALCLDSVGGSYKCERAKYSYEEAINECITYAEHK